MTAGIRRGPRRSKSHDISIRMAAIRRYRGAHLGSLKTDLLGKGGF
jgi:hypothetical protein